MTHEQPTAHEMEMTVSRAEFEHLQRQVSDLQKKVDDSAAISKSTNDLVRKLNDALMEPEPGHDKSLISRMASATIYLESLGRVSNLTVKLAGVIVAIGVIYASIRIGEGLDP